jgi:hypothetical protein
MDAARYMSHIALPESQRNVTIYNHVCVLSNDRESVDHVYIVELYKTVGHF